MLEEACLLANAIGLEVVHSEVIALAKLRAGSYFGKGVTERLGDLAEDFTHDIGRACGDYQHKPVTRAAAQP